MITLSIDQNDTTQAEIEILVASFVRLRKTGAWPSVAELADSLRIDPGTAQEALLAIGERGLSFEQAKVRKAAAKARKGTRLAETELPSSWRAWAQEKTPELDAESVFEAFRDYWVGIPGARGCKLDWPATWRNWCRREAASRKPRPRPKLVAGAAARKLGE